MHIEQAKIWWVKTKKLPVTIYNKNTKMIYFDDVIKENIKEHNRNWPQTPNYPYRILITEGPGSGDKKLII